MNRYRFVVNWRVRILISVGQIAKIVLFLSEGGAGAMLDEESIRRWRRTLHGH